MNARIHRQLSTAALALAGGGCAELAGVDDYAVEPPAVGTVEDVRAFLAKGADDPAACASCVERKCAREVDACAADLECRSTASCMAACSDPACLLSECRGASLPFPASALGLLAEKASNECRDACSIGRSWTCSGRYTWPAVPSSPFTFSMAFDLFNTPDTLAGVPVRICDYGAECLVKPSAAYAESVGISRPNGSVALSVHPVTGVSGATLPPWFLQIDASSKTLVHRLEAPQGMLPDGGRSSVADLS